MRRRWRALLAQAGVLLALIGGCAWLASVTASNLARRGATSGFGFLLNEAGFGLGEAVPLPKPGPGYLLRFAVVLVVLGVLISVIQGLRHRRPGLSPAVLALVMTPLLLDAAAAALGLTWLQRTRLVVLPQALRLVRPALVGTVIAFVKGSTLVVAIGLYDLLGSAVLASANPRWLGATIEPLLFVAAIFWAICFTLSRLSEISVARGTPDRLRQRLSTVIAERPAPKPC